MYSYYSESWLQTFSLATVKQIKDNKHLICLFVMPLQTSKLGRFFKVTYLALVQGLYVVLCRMHHLLLTVLRVKKHINTSLVCLIVNIVNPK